MLGPEQIKAINSEKRIVLLMGEAGTGKTTVLLATLFKYTGKHVVEEDRKKVMFSIPHHKKTLKNDIFSFIKHFCVRKWVEIVLGFDVERVCRNTGSTVYLFDEIYDTQFVSRILMRGKIYAVVIPGEKMTFELKNFHSTRPDLELIYFRKIYRTPAEVSRCCVKLKRLLDEEKYKMKKPVTTNSLDYNFTHQEIPWEMSFSNSTPLREGNAIEIKCYQSLQMEDFKSSIRHSDLIVTLDFENEKIEEMDLSFDTNTVFHENPKNKDYNEQTAVGRSSNDGLPIIVLICGENFTKESLISQQGLLRYIELKHCVVYVICHYSVLQEIEQFSFNFGSMYIYEEPVEIRSSKISSSLRSSSSSRSSPRSTLSIKCREMHEKICQSKLKNDQTHVITFCQTMKVVTVINSIFKNLAVIHVQIKKTCLQRSGYIEVQRSNQIIHHTAIAKEMVLVFGVPFRNQIPVLKNWPCLVELVHEGCSLTLISEDFTLDGSAWTSTLLKELRRDIVEGLTKSLEIPSLVNEKDIRAAISNDLTELVSGDVIGVIDQKWIELFDENLMKAVIDDFTNCFIEDFSRKLITKALENLAEDLAVVAEKRLTKLVDETLRQVYREKLPELVDKYLPKSPHNKKNWPYVEIDTMRAIEELHWKLKTLKTMITETWCKCCKKYAIKKTNKTLKKLEKYTQTQTLQNFETKALERLIDNVLEFDKKDLKELFETLIFTRCCSSKFYSSWVCTNVHIFNTEVLRSVVNEDLRILFDHKLQTGGMESARVFVRNILHKIPEVEVKEWVRRNFKIFNKEVLRSLVAERYSAFKSLAEALVGVDPKESFMEDLLNSLTVKNLKTLIISYSVNFLTEDIKKCLYRNSSNVKETVSRSSYPANNKWIDLNDQDLKTLIGEYFMKFDYQYLKKWVRKFLGNIEFLRILTDENERRGLHDVIFRNFIWLEMADGSPSEVIDEFTESINETLATVLHEYIKWNIEPMKQMWDSSRQSNLLNLSPNSAQLYHLLPLFNYLEENRLVITFNVDENVSKLMDGFFCNDTVFHWNNSNWDSVEDFCLPDHQDNQKLCPWFERVHHNHTVKKEEHYDTVIFVISRKMNAQFTISDFHTAFWNCSEFIFLSDKEVHESLVTKEFQLNSRPFFEILQYSDSSTNDENIELIPTFEQQNILLLAWNVDEKLSEDIEETFLQYEFERIPGAQAEFLHLRTENQEINSVILFCGKLEGKTYLSEKILDAITHLRIKLSICIVCHDINSHHIKSVFLSCNKYNFLEKKLWPNLSEEPIDVGSAIPTIDKDTETKVLILTWNISPDISRIVDDTFQNCTIRRVDAPQNLLENAYDEIILACGAPMEINAIASGLRWFSRYIRFRCNFYLVSDQNYFSHIASVLPPETAFHFSLNFCFFGDSVIDQIRKVPVLKRQSAPKVFLLTLNLDKNTALEIDNKFTSYRTKHVDLMPWSSDSLPFTGSEFDNVVVICNEHTNAQSHETKSVLYSALTRAKQKAIVFCHKNTESHFRKLLSLSSTDQIFHKIRTLDNVGEKLPSYLENQHDILEAFKRIIVSKNFAQFNSLKKFVSECTDPSFDWVFHRVQSMLVRCFPWGLEIVQMLNKFLTWRPASRSEVNIFNSPSFFSGVGSTKEERMRILEGIEMDLKSTDLEFDTMDTTELKNLALSAVVWNQMVLFDEVFQRLKIKLSLNDDFFAELLHHAILLNDTEYVEKVVETIANRESRVFCVLKQTAPFIDETMFCKLVTSVRIPPYNFLTQNLSEEPFQTLIHHFASTATAQCFRKLLSLLPEKTVKLSSSNLQDDLGRNVLMSAVCNKEIFQLILNRAEQRDDSDVLVLLSQEDYEGYDCFTHACIADNIDVVKLLVKKYPSIIRKNFRLNNSVQFLVG